MDPVEDLGTVRGVAAWQEASRHVTVAIYGQRIGRVIISDFCEESFGVWWKVDLGRSELRSRDDCRLVAAGRRLVVLRSGAVLQFFSRNGSAAAAFQLDLSAAKPDLASVGVRFGPELHRGLAFDRKRPLVLCAQGSLTVAFS